ncbi:MAG: hypothetical protein CO012_03775 [Syntrophobacterales bacterium CG_4_8_14_3_um_filter_49_14]|nr:MAG: hypothetical protein COX52_04120 [Syntrophobacterales bacterium CG23_combo_of_CG06-09_8_20_14_all_48_27]PJA49406.1 MAG: hypothetical protein CO171_05285 [Syntrophobacterales bacterium CG_4_9_14_3_um_filter_49_8]PJC75276.1 MAG: hypothetical protein CO012_03775 [Syntrophobacterales bacterium CG_4_8_14_3_um_filter_49_14]
MFGVQEGFDVVIGNPPYVRVDDIPSDKKSLYRASYEAAKGKYDLYYLFFEKGLALLQKAGGLIFITPNKFCAATSGTRLREIMRSLSGSIEIVSTSKLGVFEDAANYPVVSMFVPSSGRSDLHVREAVSLGALRESSMFSYRLTFKDWVSLPDRTIPINVSQSQVDMVLRLRHAHSRLGDYVGFSEGLRIPACFETDKKNSHLILKQYQFEKWTTLRKGAWISTANLRKVLSEKSERYQRIMRKKIVLAEDALSITATMDEQQTIPQGGVYFGVTLRDDVDPKYVLGILNSGIASALYEIMFSGMHMGGGYMRYRTMFLEELPIPLSDSCAQTTVVRLVDQILATKATDPAANTSALEGEIDRLVYDLYGLTEEEIAIIEGRE